MAHEVDLDPSWFDSSELISSGKYSRFGKRMNIFVEDPKQLDATILKTDTAYVTIPELSLEEASGTGRYISLGDLLREMYGKLQSSSGYFSGPQRARFDKMMDRMSKIVTAEESFCMVVDDPLGNSFVKWDSDIPAIRIEEEEYTRSWDQNEELGIPQDFENIEANDNSNEQPETVPAQMEYTTEEAVDELAKLIYNSWNIVALTGAGISVESGIPAFRGGEDSIWTKYDPMNNTYQNFLNSKEVQARYWQMKKEIWGIVSKAHPNPSHEIFARLQNDNKLLGVVTQNIDGLHERSGVDADKVCNLHGTLSSLFCDHCMKTYDKEVYEQVTSGKTDIPTCGCGGPIRPSCVFFGEPLDPLVLERAKEMISNCDLLIVMGSSLVVQPANTLPRIAFQNKTPVVIINLEETQYDKFASIVVHQPCGKTMSAVQDALSKL